ncbi:MAG TPA: glycosyltransferase family 4 protein [Solirubrobacterales bacterium]|nr:glycosyltransferase family 4 protein [Solirubrobacterales bacterium]
MPSPDPTAPRPRRRILVVSNLYPPAVLGGYEVECSGIVARLREENEVLVLTSKRGRGEVAGEQGVARVLDFLPHSPRSRLLAPLYALRAARATRALIREFGPEVVYVWNGAQIPQVAIRLLELSGARVLVRVCEHWYGKLYETDAFMQGVRGGRWAPLMRLVNRLPGLRIEAERQVPAAICWNSATVERMTPVPPTARAVLERVVIPATRQSESFVGIERRPSPEPSLGFVGRVAPEKGIEVVLRAMARLEREHGIRASFEIGGSGEPGLIDELKALAAELGLADRVHWRGRLDVEGLRGLYAGLHALVVPSTWEEPAPLVIVEGALARVPLVCSRVGGIPDMVRDPEEALLFGSGDDEGLCEALRRMLAEPEETAARAERAYERVQAFRIDRYHEAMDEFFEAGLAALDAGSA